MAADTITVDAAVLRELVIDVDAQAHVEIHVNGGTDTWNSKKLDGIAARLKRILGIYGDDFMPRTPEQVAAFEAISALGDERGDAWLRELVDGQVTADA